ncbi:MAG: hypothetical protein R3B90_16030 [Planctomycetaceae bacterium]
MVELTASARAHLDEYLAELRRVLSECPTLDAAEVERDVDEHIQTALAHRASPIDATSLDGVLRELDAPADWVQDQRVPWFKRPPRDLFNDARATAQSFTRKLAAGPESYRLPYIALLTLLLGCLPPLFVRDGILFTFAAIAASFVLARAALSLHESRQPSHSQLWLIAPSLLLVYAPLVVALLGWPLLLGGTIAQEQQYLQVANQRLIEQMVTTQLAADKAFADQLEALRRQGTPGEVSLLQAEHALMRQRTQDRIAAIESRIGPHHQFGVTWTFTAYWAATLLVAGVWWLLLGLTMWLWPGLLRTLLRPFANKLPTRTGLIIATFGLLAIGGGWLLKSLA